MDLKKKFINDEFTNELSKYKAKTLVLILLTKFIDENIVINIISYQ